MGRALGAAFFVSASLAMAATQAAAQTADRYVSFQQFLQGVRSAGAAQFVGRSRIGSSTAFAEMRAHILGLYDSVHVTHSFVMGSQYFDCVPVMEQPSVRAQGLDRLAEPPPARPDGSSGVELTPQTEDYAKDQFGNAVGCGVGTVPMRRVTLEEMGRFRTLHEFFRKGPDGAGEFNTRAASDGHKYAHASQAVKNFGGGSNLNLWSPAVSPNTNAFSLSQQWWTTMSGKVVQTVEGGWQHYPDKYGKTLKSVLFIYFTADGYDKTGCYNLDCSAFVQTNNKIKLGGPFDKYSSVGGAQREFRLEWFLYVPPGQKFGNWFLYLNGSSSPIGYYPGSLWKNRGLAQSATSIDFGGETVTNAKTTYPPMGSGQWASAGEKKAAYQNDITYFPTVNSAKEARLKIDQPNPKCYKIDLHNSSGVDGWFSYFYFGGPGGKIC
jgi:hypothetical protein